MHARRGRRDAGPSGLEVSRNVPPTTEPPVGLRTALLCASF